MSISKWPFSDSILSFSNCDSIFAFNTNTNRQARLCYSKFSVFTVLTCFDCTGKCRSINRIHLTLGD